MEAGQEQQEDMQPAKCTRASRSDPGAERCCVQRRLEENMTEAYWRMLWLAGRKLSGTAVQKDSNKMVRGFERADQLIRESQWNEAEQ